MGTYCSRFRLMFEDEAGFGRINKPKRCWCIKGYRPSVPCHHIREYVYAYGAVSPQDGELFGLVMPYTNTVCMNRFLQELSIQYPDDYILLVVDNASWHRSKALEIPPNIELFPSLPYTPELSPIEMIWDDMREKSFRNEAFKTLHHVIDRLCDAFTVLFKNPARVSSITCWDWINSALCIRK